MATNDSKTQPRERIMETAAELFFHQGYRATGINEVIAKSGVAKATFYNHFPTKEDLCLAYLQDRNAVEFDAITTYVHEQRSPQARFMAVIESIEPWIVANSMRGCAFLNMVAEVPDPGNRLRREGRRHYNMLRELVLDLSEKLIAADEGRHAHLDAAKLADDYLVILVGAIAAAEVYNDPWPVRQGIRLIEELIA